MGVLNKILNTKNNEFDSVAILPSALEYRYVTNASLKNNNNECAKWQEQLEQTDSNLEIQHHSKERLPSGHTLPWRAWRTANRVRSGRQAATPAAKHLWGYRDSKNCVCAEQPHATWTTSCSPQHKHWPTGPAHFSDCRASTGQYIVSFTGPAGPPS